MLGNTCRSISQPSTTYATSRWHNSRHRALSVKLHRRDERTNGCVYQGRPSYGGGERTGTLRRNLMGEKGKNPGSTNKHKEFGQLIIRNIVKIIATGYHILRLNAPISRRLSVRSFVRPFVSYTESVWHLQLSTKPYNVSTKSPNWARALSPSCMDWFFNNLCYSKMQNALKSYASTYTEMTEYLRFLKLLVFTCRWLE